MEEEKSLFEQIAEESFSESEEEVQNVEETNNEEGQSDEAGLMAALESISLDMDFGQRLDVVSESPLDLNGQGSDLKREIAFYNYTLEAVLDAKDLLAEFEVPYLRPIDYYAEMLKSDEHMRRIKDEILFQQKKMMAFEQRKKAKQYKAFAKEIEQEKKKLKAQRTKQQIDAVTQIRKGLKSNNSMSLDEALEDKKPSKPSKQQPNKRRLAKNSRYGHKRNDKRNSAASAAEDYDNKKRRGGRNGGRPNKRGRK
eukprot:TRINITY_DN780035_c0_g1_i1.p1 TRINITY_DN780035_c0_g1~~TRINITY_DN780035_c0_g1_i1.p1  ORF type:complete len:254 (-),score=95.32 TRINITY_DN780035_c0_g1_i1:247-1008(-)